MAKKSQRTKEQQEYRDNLAKQLKELRGQGDTGRELAKNLLEENKLSGEYIDAMGNGRKYGKDIAKKLIEERGGRGAGFVVEHIEEFKKSDYEEIIDILIKERKCELVAKNIDKFEGLDYDMIIKKVIEGSWGADYLAHHIYDFEISDPNLLDELIKTGYALVPRYYLEKCNSLTHKEIAERRVDIGCSRELATNLDKFEGLSKNDGLSKEIAMRLIDDRDIATKRFLENFDKFELTDEEVMEIVERVLSIGYRGNYIANMLIRAGYGDVVAKHPEKFGLKKEDK